MIMALIYREKHMEVRKKELFNLQGSDLRWTDANLSFLQVKYECTSDQK